jgi:Protein of unknown function (DUF3025)
VNIDWRAPWLAPFAEVAEADPPGLPVRFVPASALEAGQAYEAFIARTQSVPTRDNLHDFYNRLVWRRHPGLKQRLNQLQAAEIARCGVGATRGALRDALTLFDENGALWPDAPPPLAQALQRKDWRALFVTHRALWQGHRFQIVGHALLEQLTLAPRKPLTAHVLLADPMALDPADWAAKPFCPLPVLGIPGWWPANEDPAFYEDTDVFRPPRGLKAQAPT